MTTIKAIIFDLGKVVFDLSFDRVYEHWANSSGKSVDEIRSRFVFDDIFNQFERSDLAPQQFRAAISQRLNIKLSDKDFDDGWCSLYLDEYAGIDQLLLKLKLTHRIVALTNTNEIHNTVWRMKYAKTLALLEKIFSSHELATRKPEPEIYRLVLNYLNLKPEETLFLDDNIDNIRGAQNLGIATILVASPAQMRVDLGRMLGVKLTIR
jgi:putative hydrolase of the HAD superfamily